VRPHNNHARASGDVLKKPCEELIKLLEEKLLEEHFKEQPL